MLMEGVIFFAFAVSNLSDCIRHGLFSECRALSLSPLRNYSRRLASRAVNLEKMPRTCRTALLPPTRDFVSIASGLLRTDMTSTKLDIISINYNSQFYVY